MEVQGNSLEELFVNAAAALTSSVIPGPDVTGDSEIDVVLAAETLEDLLVDWLREILFQNQAHGFAFRAVDFEELSRTRLKARLFPRPALSEQEPELEIKGVTYHGLSVRETDTGYVARIVFDV